MARDCSTCARGHTVFVDDPVQGIERIDCPHILIYLYRWKNLVWDRRPFRNWGFGKYVCRGQVTNCPGWKGD